MVKIVTILFQLISAVFQRNRAVIWNNVFHETLQIIYILTEVENLKLVLSNWSRVVFFLVKAKTYLYFLSTHLRLGVEGSIRWTEKYTLDTAAILTRFICLIYWSSITLALIHLYFRCNIGFTCSGEINY